MTTALKNNPITEEGANGVERDGAGGIIGGRKQIKKRKGVTAMGMTKIDDILGYNIDGQVLCDKCASDAQKDEAADGDFILQDSAETDEFIFSCDVCHKRIS
jgi:hypothetical protein